MTEPRGQVGGARAGRVGPHPLRIASHGHRMRLRPRWLSNVGNVAATWHGARCARVRERRNAGTVFAFLALGAGTIPPAPRNVTCGVPVGWSLTCVPVYRYAVLGSPTYLSCYRFYGHFVGVFPNAQKHVVNRWSLCRIAPRFRLVNCGGRCPQSLRVPRVLVCSSRQLNRQPAPRRPLPRRGYKENTKKTALYAVYVWF